MEGLLNKWTNYWNGWQPRWFILDNGVLSYYKSLEEVNEGCRGSIKLSVCEISVHPTDPLRIDIRIPGEIALYVRAPTPQEKQQWLVALGTSKACLSDVVKKEDFTSDSLRVKQSELRMYGDLLTQQAYALKQAAANRGDIDISALDESASLLSVTCDTFLQTLEECIKLGRDVSTPQPFLVPHSPVVESFAGVPPFHSKKGQNATS
ncbi:pleckstrin homology domain-containing family A member 3-like [Artemia franciscana]|uniref:PH domain-containing protein n=1 Tax=Artemia franciscana TaxID=6661 RepID=A0AA88KV35_ARTSF|nr:hypothetical protein QYM36_013962 [Artemia franciscana]